VQLDQTKAIVANCSKKGLASKEVQSNYLQNQRNYKNNSPCYLEFEFFAGINSYAEEAVFDFPVWFNEAFSALVTVNYKHNVSLRVSCNLTWAIYESKLSRLRYNKQLVAV
jgi:hypothetical protein